MFGRSILTDGVVRGEENRGDDYIWCKNWIRGGKEIETKKNNNGAGADEESERMDSVAGVTAVETYH